MASTVTFYINSFVWNGITFDCDEGGPLELRIRHSAELIKDRSGCDVYATFVKAVNAMLGVTLRVRQMLQPMDIGTKSDATATVQTSGGPVDIPLPGLVYYDADMGVSRATPGECTLIWEHQSDDGTSNPLG